MARVLEEDELFRVARAAEELARLLRRVEPVLGPVDEEERARRDPVNDELRPEAQEEICRLERDVGTEAGLAVELLVDVAARDLVEADDVERRDELRPALAGRPRTVLGERGLEPSPALDRKSVV